MRLLLLPLLFAAIPLAAQGERCFSIHNGPGYIDTDVSFYLEGDIITVTVPAPATSVQAVNAVENAIRARGYQVSRADPNTICVTAGPGGSLLRDGHGITTDGLSGYWLDLDRGQRPPQPPSKDKKFGMCIPAPRTNVTSQGGCLQLQIELVQLGLSMTRQVQVDLPYGMAGTQLQNYARSVLQSAGFQVNGVKFSDLRQPGVLLDGFALDRTVDGAWSVAHVEIQPDAQAALVVPLALFAGLPDYGATEYGDATVGSASSEPFARVQGDGLRGTSLLFEGFTWLPYVPAGVVFNFRPLAAPLLNGTLMVDPNGAGFRVAFSDHLGVVRSNWFVPPSTSLHGLEFDTQGIAADPAMVLTMTTGVRVVVY